MNKFTIWAEGYVATGDSAPASCLGVFEAESFDDAVVQCKNSSKDAQLFYKNNMGSWSYWGCMLFDNEYAARRNYG